VTTTLSPVDALPPLPAHMRGLNVRDFLEQEAARQPDAPFVVTRDTELTYAAFDARVNRAAAAWQARGIAKGDRVAFMLDNSADFLVAWLGLAKIGAILVGLNTRWKALEARDALARTDPRLVLADGAHLETVRAVGAVDVLPLRELVAAAERGCGDFVRPPLEATDPISFIFTSGTTGHPKAVQQTHGAYVLTGQAYPWWLGLERGDRIYACLPLLHVNAQAYSTMGTIGMGGTLTLVERFSAGRFWDDVRASRANAFNFIGAVVAILLKAEPGPHERDHELKVMYGAPSFPEPERAAIEERFGVRIISGFGMSEATFGLIEDVHGERRPGSMGKARLHPDPAFTNEARVVDAAGRDLPAGEAGELVIRNAAIMRGYYDDPERTAESLRDGWLWTGDLAVRDEDGFFSYVDRKKDIVRRRGENVSSVEVEVVLTAHPAVAEAAVIGIPSELTDEEVLAFVQPLPGHTADPAELAAWCAERLADFKVPRYVQVVEALPRTSTGKLQKGELREGLADPASWWDRECSP
jgi:crotonobetaine/carnitine-CoA ligase